MLTLTLQNKVIPLPTDFSMRLTVKSPVCNFEKIPFSYSLDFSLPMNKYTSAILGKPERTTKQRLSNDQKIPGFAARVSGGIVLSGTLIVKVSGGNYDLSAIDLVGELSEKEQERNILDITKFSEQIDWVNSSNYDPNVHEYCHFPVINTGFFRDKGVKAKRTAYETGPEGTKATNEKYDIEVLTYCFSKSTNSRVNMLDVDGTVKLLPSTIDITRLTERYNTYSTGEVSVVTPFFFLKNIIREVLKANQFHILENCLAEISEFKNLCIYNNYDITENHYSKEEAGEGSWQAPEYAVDPDGNDIYTGDWQSAGRKIYSYVRMYEQKKITIKNHLPKMTVGELLVSTQNKLNVCVDFLPNRTINIFSREELLSREAIDIDKYFVGNWVPGDKKNVSLKFVREHDKNDEVFAARYVDLSDRHADIKPSVIDWETLFALPASKEGDIRFITSVGVFAEFKLINQVDQDPQTDEEFTVDTLGWEEISIGLQNGWYNYGQEQTEEIKTAWSTCYGNATNTLVNQPGNMDAWKAKEQAFSPRLLCYKGNNQGANQTDNFSFEYEKTGNGLIPKYWKRTAKWWANRLPMTGYFDFSENALRSIIQNKCLPYRTREAAFMIEKIEVDLYVDRIGKTELTVFKRD